jgi:hypothetical protein
VTNSFRICAQAGRHLGSSLGVTIYAPWGKGMFPASPALARLKGCPHSLPPSKGQPFSFVTPLTEHFASPHNDRSIGRFRLASSPTAARRAQIKTVHYVALCALHVPCSQSGADCAQARIKTGQISARQISASGSIKSATLLLLPTIPHTPQSSLRLTAPS